MTLKEINEILSEIKENERRYDNHEINCLPNRKIKTKFINAHEYYTIIYNAQYRAFYKIYIKNSNKIGEEIIKNDEIIFQLIQ